MIQEIVHPALASTVQKDSENWMSAQKNAPKIEAVEQNRDQRCDEEFVFCGTQ